jgi:Mg2+-importing ATPase
MVLENGVEEGRKTFANMLKYIKITASSNFGNVFSVLIASAFLPFEPMLPIHLLIQNLLYDISQVVIPFDNVDKEFIAKPQKWNPKGLLSFMIFFGPLSSIFDVITFVVLWNVYHANTIASAALFQSGWFIEGLLTQTLIVHMIRTRKIPFLQSRAAWSLIVMTLVIVTIGISLPMGSIASYVSMTAVPLSYFSWVFVIVIGYMVLVQLMKGFYERKFGWQ